MFDIFVVVVAVFVNVVAVIVFGTGTLPNGPLSSCHPPKGENIKAGVWMSNDDSDTNDRSRSWVLRLSKNLMKRSIVDSGNGEKGPFSFQRKKLPSRMIK